MKKDSVMRSIVPKQDIKSYENVYRRQVDDETENQEASIHHIVRENAEASAGTLLAGTREAFRDEESVEEFEYEKSMSVSELLYSTSSFYAIVVPGASQVSEIKPIKSIRRQTNFGSFLKSLAP